MRIAKLASLFILVIVSAPVLFVLNDSYHISSNLKVSQPNEPLFIPVEESGVVMSGFQAMTQVNPTLPMNVLVTLGFNHKGLLSLTLNQLQDPFSHIYHNYLSASKFISDFSPSAQEYES